ncbi:hypothetical protein [Phyllobacterium sp. YR531]|uniref:hypothetical protein n=1 Tax=Phyllobacterium sp. YR531 TaxID=1144343 RepID=UPI00026F63B8|nr:hypothetical protein [Phyllobacterium sp. YR531]EJN05693.1 hypothetical protein PMI41_00900 [Phyllobacterium sp. YR531]
MTTTIFRTIQLAVIGSLMITTVPAGAQQQYPTGSYQVAQWDGNRSCRDSDRWERDRCWRQKDKWRDERRHDERKRERRREKKEKDAAIAAGIIGLTLGAVAIGAANQAAKKRDADRERRARCSDRYGEGYGTYIGRDGRRYRC